MSAVICLGPGVARGGYCSKPRPTHAGGMAIRMLAFEAQAGSTVSGDLQSQLVRGTRQATLGCPHRHLRPRPELELAENVLHVYFDCSLGDHHRGGNVAITQTPSDEA